MLSFDPYHVAAAFPATTYPPTDAGLAQALADLGDTANQVADTLLAAGCRGKKGCDTTCPVANYLSPLFPDHNAYVMAEQPEAGITAELWPHGANEADVVVLVPEAVQAFVERFDGGYAYADLAWPDGEAA